MTSFKKTLNCLGLVAILALPLAACTNTWHGMKSDWHGMTNTSDKDKRAVPAETTSTSQTTTTTTTPEGTSESTTTTTTKEPVVIRPMYNN